MIEKLIERSLEDQTFPGIVLIVEKDGRRVLELAEGETGYGGFSRPMEAGALFDLASLTKPLATTTTFLSLCGAESIDLGRRAGDFLPDLNREASDITLTQLMTHTSGLPPIPEIFKLFRTEKEIDRQRALSHLFSIRPEVTPGTEVIYSCTGYILLTRILEKIAGCTLAEAFDRLITGPAGIADLVFNPDGETRRRCVPTEYCAWRGRMLAGEVHDENSFCLGGEGGNAGLFGTAEAVSALAELFNSEGVLAGRQLLSPEHVRMMTSRQIDLEPARALGFLTQSGESFAGPGFSADAFGHTGFTGTSLWMDNKRGLKVVALTNRVHPGRDLTAEKIKAFRLELHRIILETIC